MNRAVRPLEADFHTHSTASDGTLAPAELIEESARRGLRVVALTDHDTTQGVQDAVQAGKRVGVRVIAGIEFSVSVQRGELHLLGYGIDPDYLALATRLADLRDTRRERAVKIAQRLADIGIQLPDDLLDGMAESESIGRPHIARELIRMGVVDSVSEGFERYLARGRPGFVSRELIQPEDAIRLVREAGGVAVMAHPLSVPAYRELVPALVDAGLSGIECYYGRYDVDRREELASFARELGLLATGGSDFHGPGVREGRELGAVEIPPEAVEALLIAVGSEYLSNSAT